MDAIVISHTAALHAIRYARTAYARLPWVPLTRAEQKQILKHASSNAASIDIEYLERLGIIDHEKLEPLDLIVGDPSNRRSNNQCTCHLQSKPLPAGSLYKIVDGIYCISPAFAAAQFSLNHSLSETAMLLLELLGTYSMTAGADLPESRSGQASFGCEAAMSSVSLKTMTKWATSSSYSKYRTAASLAAEGSASPMESLVYAMLGFPMRLGGFGCARLPKGGMILNHRIDFDYPARQISSNMSHAICDCFIPSANIDIEYNGFYHEQQNARVHDGNRNNGLKSMGITVLVINKEQAQDLNALEAMAQLAHANAKKRFRYQHAGYRTLQRNLLMELRHAISLS